MTSPRKMTVMLAAVALAALGMVGTPVHAASAIHCNTTVVVDIDPPQTIGSSSNPDPSTTFAGFISCAGAVKGVVPLSGKSESNPSHCTANPPNSDTSDEVLWDTWCGSPLFSITGITHIGPGQNSAGPFDDGSTCSWTTNGHALVTTSFLDLKNFNCFKPGPGSTKVRTFGPGSGNSYGTAAIIFDPTLSPPTGTCEQGSIAGSPHVAPCFRKVVSQAFFDIIGP